MVELTLFTRFGISKRNFNDLMSAQNYVNTVKNVLLAKYILHVKTRKIKHETEEDVWKRTRQERSA